MEKNKIIELLKNINHPGHKNDIVSLNILKEIAIQDNKVAITLKYTKLKDPFANSIRKNIEKLLLDHFGNQIVVSIDEQYPSRALNSEFTSLDEITNLVAIASCKGGVGKSTVAVNLAIAVSQLGYKVGLLDADVYGPSVPKMFGEENFRPVVKKIGEQDIIEPLEKYGIKVNSIGFYVNPNEALVWRGPMASNALKQIIGQTQWGALDFLFIDLPPGTGDIHLTIVQSMPVTGAVIVSTPQEVALADVIKGIGMFRNDKINVPVLGLVENMAWFTPDELPDNKYYIFGKEGCKNLAHNQNIPLLGQIPIVQSICENGDSGKPSAMNPFKPDGKAFAELAEAVVKQLEIRNESLPSTQKVQIQKQ